MLAELLEVDHKSCSPRDFQVVPTSLHHIKPFITQNHYSHSCHGNGSPICFSLVHKNELIGGMIYGLLAMHNQWKVYQEYGV